MTLEKGGILRGITCHGYLQDYTPIKRRSVKLGWQIHKRKMGSTAMMTESASARRKGSAAAKLNHDQNVPRSVSHFRLLTPLSAAQNLLKVEWPSPAAAGGHVNCRQCD